MNRKQIKDYLFSLYSIDNMGRSWRKVQCNKELKRSVEECTKYLEKAKLSERIYHIIFDLYERPICKFCQRKEVSFRGFKIGYSKYCSGSCSSKDEEIINKVKESNKLTYSKNKDEIKDKIKKTNLEKYGVEDPNQLNEIKDKIKKTNLEKYGVEYTHQNPQFLDKVKRINLEKYGVEYSFQTDEVKEKIRNTNLQRYGTSNIREVDEINNKIKKTNLERYGVENVFEDKNKIQKSILEKYGVNNVSELQSVIIKRHETRLKNFIPILKKNAEKLNLELLSDYEKDRDIAKWKCKICNNVFEKEWFHLNQGFLCPYCYPRNPGTSITELEISDFLKSLSINTIYENYRDSIKPYELDIYLPDYNIAIEFNGLYWHSDKILKDKNYHLNKTNLCKEKGIRLIHIFEDEWIFKQDIVKERLKKILNVNDFKRIHARKCLIKEISPKLKNEFLEKYHLQGKDSSSIKLGAFYNNELISVMTFSHGNISKGSKSENKKVWELNRFCSNYNYHIPGIASKLLEYFKRNYEWEKIFSYADRRWSEGNLYQKLGFIYDYDTLPNYWYIKECKRIHRFNLRKRPDEPKDIPEWILRKNEGYLRLWDCGNMKFSLYK